MTDDEILDLEERFPAMNGRKERAITASGLHLVRYLQRLNRLMRDPATRAARPMLVARWERIRDSKWNGGTRA